MGWRFRNTATTCHAFPEARREQRGRRFLWPDDIMGRLLTPDRLAQDQDGAILEDVTIKGASTSLAALSVTPHVLAPVAELPVLEIVSSVHMVCEHRQLRARCQHMRRHRERGQAGRGALD